MFRQALLGRHACILIDGLNEASTEGGLGGQGGTLDSIERHLTEVLAAQGGH